MTCGLWDAYRDFRDKYRNVYPSLKRRQYVDVCYDINKTISEKIIKESFEFRMPYRLGTLSVKKNKLKIKIVNNQPQKNKLVPDWEKCWEMWHKEHPGKSRKEINAIKGKIAIYNMNYHTNGFVMRWTWDRGTCYVKNHSVYQFKPTKANRLALAAWIKSDDRENDYVLNESYESRSKKQLLREFKKERVQEVEEVRD
jgi:hypothetical protein